MSKYSQLSEKDELINKLKNHKANKKNKKKPYQERMNLIKK